MKNHKANIVKLIKKVSYRHGAWKVFTDFLALAAISISNAVDHHHREKREARYMEIIAAYDKKEADMIVKMLAELIMALDVEMTDVLGQVYMELELGNKWVGQFFTPMHICETMAKIIVPEADNAIEKRGYITVSEPACGGGAMIIGLAKAMKEAGHNYQKQMIVVATDIDIKSVYMCYTQLSLIGIPAVVYHGDTISLKMYSEWYTPMYIFDGWYRRQWQKEKKVTVARDVKTGEQGKLELEVTA